MAFRSAVKLSVASVHLVCALALSPWSVFGQAAEDYVIGPQDVLAIQVFDQPDLGGSYTVDIDGTFTFPLIGRIKAAGFSLRQFEAELRKALSDGYFKAPQVTVAVTVYRSQHIFVMGEVGSSGLISLTGGMSLIEALARAGGITSSASGEVVIVRPSVRSQTAVLPGETANAQLIRSNVRDLEAGTMSQNIELRDGDTLFVPRANTIYIFGQVARPGAYAIQDDTTVLQALALAGGVSGLAATNRIHAVRIVDGEEKKVRLKLGDLVKPGDTLVVPERYF